MHKLLGWNANQWDYLRLSKYRSIRVGADYTVVAKSTLRRVGVMTQRAKGVAGLVLFYLTTLKQMF